MQRFQARNKEETREFDFAVDRSVAELKAHLISVFRLQSCKIIGLRIPKKPENEVKLSSLRLRKGLHKIRAMGPSAEEAASMEQVDKLYEEKMQIEAMLEEEARKEHERQKEQARIEAKKREEERREREEKRRIEWEQEQERRRQQRENARGMNFMASRSDTVEGAVVRLTVQAQESKEADRKNRLILPQSALERVLEAKVPFPLTFKILSHSRQDGNEMEIEEPTDVKNGPQQTVVHASVSEFTAPASTAYVPKDMLSRLGVGPGAILNLESVALPKAKSVTLQPVTTRWFEIDEEERKSILEFYLRGHQFLESGGTISISYLGENLQLRVKAIMPKVAAVSITDTDLSTEVVEAERKLPDIHKPLEVSKATSIDLIGSEYSYLKFEVKDVSKAYLIQLAGPALKVGVDMYLSASEKKPSHIRFDKAAQFLEQPELSISDADSFFSQSIIYLALRAPENKDAKTSVTVRLTSKSKGSSQGHVLGTGVPPTAAPVIKSSQFSECENCRRPIPTSRMTMHRLQCVRRNTYCKECKTVVPKRHFRRHNLIQHGPIICPDCGLEVLGGQAEMKAHLLRQCKMRAVVCLFCPIRLRFCERDAHVRECGVRPCICLKCGQPFKKREMKYHLTSKHGMRPEDVSFRDYA
ncbi:hypothetical protein AAMO2058_000544900 [Amorphochlora amoebiformis]|mmetsp:Transcript_25410/g.40136  ORF Transcript_25410/g.40136 Transcript_25410/m.40136 type:complete len:643 (-) Transcript_25410:160-2088(-)